MDYVSALGEQLDMGGQQQGNMLADLFGYSDKLPPLPPTHIKPPATREPRIQLVDPPQQTARQMQGNSNMADLLMQSAHQLNPSQSFIPPPSPAKNSPTASPVTPDPMEVFWDSPLAWLGSLPQKARGLYDAAGSVLPSWMYDAGAEIAGMLPGVGNVPTKDIRAALPTGADTFIPPSNEAGLSNYLETILRLAPGGNYIGSSGVVPQTVSRVNRAHSVGEAIGLPWLTPAEVQQLKQKLNEQATYKFP